MASTDRDLALVMWEPIVNGLPDDWSVNVIYEHPRNANLLFVGNEIGLYVSIDRGDTWVAVSLETGRTHQIRVHMAHRHYPLVGDPV